MAHCNLCLRRIDDEEPPIPAIPMHPSCHEFLRTAPLEYRTQWIELFTQGDIPDCIADTARLEDMLDANELSLYGQNSQHMPQQMAEAVTRLIYAVSLADAGILPPEAAPVMAAIAWHADHDTGTATLTDEELERHTETITPVIQDSLGKDRFLQAYNFRRFLREQAGTRPLLEIQTEKIRQQIRTLS